MPATHPFMDFPYEVLDSTHSAPLAHHPFIVDGQMTRIGVFDANHIADPDGRVLVHLDGLGGVQAPRIVVAPQKGRFDELGNDVESPAQLGSARIFVGGAFTGFLQTSRDVVITSHVQRIDIALLREPRLRIHMGNRSSLRLVVQAGDDSVEAPVDGIALEGDMCEQGVPPGVPIAILWELDDGGLRRVLLPPIEKDTDVDLEADSSILRHGMSEAAPHTTHMRLRRGGPRRQTTHERGRPCECLTHLHRLRAGVSGRIRLVPASARALPDRLPSLGSYLGLPGRCGPAETF
jgi:hypothetical protein